MAQLSGDRLTFGKHRGEPLHAVPIGYLKWLEEQGWIEKELREAVQFEIERREGDVTSIGRQK
jgi:uncharacterized protein (DUF3820 family)